MNMTAQVQAKPTPAPSFTPAHTNLLQRKCVCGGTPGPDGNCAECRRKRLTLQRRSIDRADPSVVPPIVYDVLRSPGQPLDPTTRAFMEPHLGHDFSQVRVHTDVKAAESARAVDALAYTVGREVVFETGQYAPRTAEGQALLAHELTHVVQQHAYLPNTPSTLVPLDNDSVAEREAEHVASGLAASPAAHPQVSMLARQRRPASANQSSPSGRVLRVHINCSQTIDFETTSGLLSYQLTRCNIPSGEYTASVKVTGNNVSFNFGEAVQEGQRFDFDYFVAPGQIDPAQLFRSQGERVRVTVVQGGESDSGEGTVHFNASMLTPVEFNAMTGIQASSIPEGVIVSAQSLAGVGVDAADPLRELPKATPGAWAFTPTPMSLVPRNSTGILWTGGHLSVFANVEGALTVRGYRGNLGYYLGEMVPGIGPRFTERLIRGVPGGFENDWLFPRYAGSHTKPQTVIFLNVDGEIAGRFAHDLGRTEYGGEYRYSPPRPPGTPERGRTEAQMYERVFEGSDPLAIRCTNNCITVPVRQIQQAINTIPRVSVDGDVLDITSGTFESGRVDPYEAGRAARMREYAASPGATGARTIRPTPAAMGGMYYIRAGGVIMLLWGLYQTKERLQKAYGTSEFRVVAAEETGGWVGGILGAALGGAVGGAIACAPGGPFDAVCVVGGFIGGLVYGALLGSAGAQIGHDIAGGQ